jgi:hypothetical protein
VKRIAIALVTAALAAGCSATPVAHRAAPPPTATPGHILVGAAASSYQAFATSTGVKPAIVEHYIAPFQPLPTQFAGPAEPLVQIMPRHAPLAEVAAGKYDAWFRELAAQAKAYGRPILLGFAPEMNGPWYSWGYKSVTPKAYVAAWRRVVSVITQAGARNVTWVWTVNVVTPGVSDPMKWWPGDGYVGEVGVDGYIDTSGQSYASKIAPTVAAVRGLWDGRVLLSETSAAPQAGQPAKIRDLFAGAVADHLAGLIWFDLPGNKDWPLKTPNAIAAFRTAARRYG